MTTIIKLRRDTAANWTSENPILAAGEPGLETDTLRLKYGDGANTWANLSYQSVANATFATNATNATNANVANIANLVAVANVSGIGNIAVINLDGNAANALRGNGSFGPVDSAGTNITNGLTEVSIPTANGNVIINVDDGAAEWTFDNIGTLTTPGDITLAGDITGSAAANTLILKAQPTTDTYIQLNSIVDSTVSIAANLDIITDSSNTAQTWTFDTAGNLTLPGNTFAVNYANGSAVTLGGGNATFLGYNYTIGNAEVAGEFVISNTNPANVGTFSINPVDNANVNVENLLGYVSNNKLITTICDDQSRQATYNINSVETVTISYNGYRAVYSKLYDDDPAFCKIGFYQDTSTASVITRPDTDDDEFTVNINGGTSTLLGLAIIYTENSSFVPSNANLLEYFEHFVDNIITPAAGNITDLRTNFYDEIANTTAIISSWGEDPYNLNFYDNATNSIYTSVVPTTTSGSGIDFTANVVIAGDGTYRVISYVGGSGFNTSETITFDGTLFDGITVTNDLVLTITSVSSGVVTGFTIAGTNPGEWPTNFISDGGSDQYDTGNFLKTNQQNPVPYNDGNISNSGAFGGNDWFVGYAYGQFIFFGDNTGTPVGIFGTFGETGSDGDGTRITGYLNPPLYYTFNVNSVLDYNANLSFANGSFTLSYDIAGPNLGSIIFNNDRTISVTSGDLILNAPDDINIEPTDDLRLYGGDKQTSGAIGGDVFVYGGIGGSAFNAGNDSAGSGGRVEVFGGDAGYDDGNTALGSSGGYVQLRGGTGSGNGTGGYVEITGGQGYNSGSGGNVTINGGTGPAQSAYGNVTVNVGSYDWNFGNDGNLTLPEGGIVHETSIPFGGLEGNTIAFKPSGGTNADQQLLIYPTAGQDFNHLHLTSGNLYNTELFLGNDDFYVKLANTGNIVINTNDSTGNVGTWTFNTAGNLILPQLTTISDESEIGTTLTVGAPPTVIVISGADFSAVNTTYTKTSAATPTWEPAGYNPATDPYIEFSGGEYGIFAPSFGQALYVNTGTLNKPLTQWNINPPLGSIAPTAVYTYGTPGPDWIFGADGNLTLPGNMILAGNTNLLGSDAALIKSNNGLPLLSLSTGANSSVTSIWLENYGDIGNSNIAAIYTPLPGTGTVRIVAGTNGANINIWDFATDGALTLPANSIIQSVANNAGDGSGLSTLNLYPDNSTGDDRYLIIDPTGPNHIHIRAGGAQDASNVLLYLGGEQAYVQIDDAVHEVQIGSYDNANATSYYWRFENDGQLTIPGNLVASGASPAPTLSGFSSLSAADEIVVGSNAVVLTTSGDVSATGNISAVNIGNISSITLDGNVSNVLTGNGTFVTLPVINANTVIWSTAPVSNVAAGNVGEAAYDSGGNLYICVSANTWSKFTGTTSW